MSKEQQHHEQFMYMQYHYEQLGLSLKSIKLPTSKVYIYGISIGILLAMLCHFGFDFYTGNNRQHMYFGDYLENSIIGSIAISFVFPLVAIFLLIIAHELLHALSFHILVGGKWRDNAYLGFSTSLFCPYCWLKKPAKKAVIIISVLCPIIVLGFGLFTLSLVLYNRTVLALAFVNIVGSGGDILYVFLLLRHKSKLVLDDPTGLGFVLVQ